jgi:uncharacterized protein (DUF2336 family)
MSGDLTTSRRGIFTGLRLTKQRLPRRIDYETARDVAAEKNAGKRGELARREDVKPEILYYLASDPEADVRRHIAANPSTPVQADRLLADDGDEEVRVALARKIARLVPDLAGEEQAKLRERALDVLEVLARDQLPRVRQIVAEEIKSASNVPHALVRRLAQDLELIVAAPVLEYSPLLSDQDLLEIIATTKVAGAVAAIARRNPVTEPVSDAVVASFDVPAIAALLANPRAQIREATLDDVIERISRDVDDATEELHAPLVLRPELSIRAMRRIAGFVAASLVNVLIERHAIDDETARELKSNVRRRVQDEVPLKADDTANAQAQAEAARAAHKRGKLDEAAVSDAIDDGRREFVVVALALLSKKPVATARQVLASRAGKSVTALAWKAGLSMRTALKLQSHVAKVPHTQRVNARNGVHYPMTADEMEWHLDYFGG